jgi:glycosyltransferase involved in cell wall biosynthesis
VVTEVFFPDTIGGSGKVVYEVSKRLAGRGHKVYVLAPRLKSKLPQEEFLEGFRVYRYSIPFLSSYQIFLKILRKASLDLINFHQPLSGLSISLSREARKIPKIYTFHSSWPEEYEIKTGKKGIGSPIRKYIERSVLNRCKKMIVLSEYSKNQLLEIHKILLGKIRIIPGGVDIDFFEPSKDKKVARDKLSIPQDKFVLFTVRNLVPRMGLENLIKAMSIIIKKDKDIFLVIGGRGFLETKLKNLTEELKLNEYIKFAGFIEEEKLPLYYQAADFFILPTKYLEGFGIVTVEALSSGTPALGTPVGGTKEILGKFDERLLFRGTDSESLAELILEFKRLSPEELKNLGIKAREFVVKNYSWDIIVPQWEEVFLSAQD